MHKKFFIFFFIIAISCTSTDKNAKVKKIDNSTLKSPQVLYQISLKDYENGQLQNAIDNLKIIEKNYSYNPIAPKAILMISYIYYEVNDYIKALENLKKFKELYPANKNFPYAEFLTAICLYEQINIVSKDQTPTTLALKQFESIIKKYPNSIYANESKLKIDLINEQLAGHEMYVARYYMRKDRFISALLRLQIILEKYSDTIFVEEALHRIVEINYKIGNLSAAKKYAAILGYNFNSSDWYKKTYKIVSDKNYTIINQQRKKSLINKLTSIFSFDKDD